MVWPAAGSDGNPTRPGGAPDSPGTTTRPKKKGRKPTILSTLTGSFLIFLRISPDWQIGAQGAILIIVLALRALISRGERR